MNKKEKIIQFIIRNRYNLLLFILIAITCALTPVLADDFGNSKVAGDFIEIWHIATGYYRDWEGRFISRIIVLTIINHDAINIVLTALLITLMYDSMMKMIKPKNNSTYILGILSILLLNSFLYMQTITWTVGAITYIFPTALSIIYFSYLYRNIDKEKSVLTKTLLALANITIPMYVENIGCAFVFGNILYIFYLIYNKKDYKEQLVYTSLSIVAIAIMLMSPGNGNRITTNLQFYYLSPFEKIANNLKNFLSFGIVWHPFLIFLMTSVTNIFIYKKLKIKSKIIKSITLILFDIIPLLCIIQRIVYELNIYDFVLKFDFYAKYINTYDPSHELNYIYWIIFMTVFIVAMFKENKIKNNKKELMNIVLFLAGMSSVLIMLIVLDWSDRVAIFEVMTLSYLSLKMLDKYLDKKTIYYLLIATLSLSIMYVVGEQYAGYKINEYREKFIEEQIKDDKDPIIIIDNPIKYMQLSNPYYDYFIENFKEYYGIPKDKKIKNIVLTDDEYKNVLLK